MVTAQPSRAAHGWPPGVSGVPGSAKDADFLPVDAFTVHIHVYPVFISYKTSGLRLAPLPSLKTGKKSLRTVFFTGKALSWDSGALLGGLQKVITICASVSLSVAIGKLRFVD